MRIANYEGRLVVVAGGVGHEVAHDVEKNSGGRFGPEPQAIYEDWDAFTGTRPTSGWAGTRSAGSPTGTSSPVISKASARCGTASSPPRPSLALAAEGQP
jgi:hypothetical protein